VCLYTVCMRRQNVVIHALCTIPSHFIVCQFLAVIFQVLMVASMKMRAFCNIVLCSLVGVHQRFRGTYCLCHQCHVDWLKYTDVSEVRTASIITLMMEAVCTQSTQYYIPEGSHL
jgi:hypothetical protein